VHERRIRKVGVRRHAFGFDGARGRVDGDDTVEMTEVDARRALLPAIAEEVRRLLRKAEAGRPRPLRSRNVGEQPLGFLGIPGQ